MKKLDRYRCEKCGGIKETIVLNKDNQLYLYGQEFFICGCKEEVIK